MMLKWRRQLLPIGIDLGADGARLVQLELSGGDTLIVAGAARQRWPDDILQAIDTPRAPTPREARPVLERLHQQGLLVGRKVAVALPRELVQVKSVRLPPMPLEELQAASRIEAQQVFGIDDPNAYELRSIPVGEVRQGGEVRQEVLVLAVKVSDVESLVEQWHETGFEPVSLDFEAAALYRSMERFVRRRDDEAEVNVIIDVGHRRTSIVIGRGPDMNFFKPIDVGGRVFNDAVARSLGVTVSEARLLRGRLGETHSAAPVIGEEPVRQAVYDTLRPAVEQLGREIALCLRYFSVNFRGRRPMRVRLVGGEARDPSIVQMLSSVLPVPVEAASPISNADLSRLKAADRTTGLGDWTIAFGLSLKTCRGGLPDRLGPRRIEQVEECSTLATGAAIAIDEAALTLPADIDIRIAAAPAAEAVHA